MRKTSSILVILTLLVLSMAIFAAPVAAEDPDPPASGGGIVPLLYRDNPDCIDVGYPYGFKPQGQGDPPVEPPPACDHEKFEQSKDTFYSLRGWDPATGRPKRKKLEELGLTEVANELERLKLIP